MGHAPLQLNLILKGHTQLLCSMADWILPDSAPRPATGTVKGCARADRLESQVSLHQQRSVVVAVGPSTCIAAPLLNVQVDARGTLEAIRSELSLALLAGSPTGRVRSGYINSSQVWQRGQAHVNPI